MRKCFCGIILLLVLTGCARADPEPETVPEPEPVYGTQAESWDYSNLVIPGFEGLSSYEESANSLVIHPISSRENSIEIRQLLTGDYKFWDAVVKSWEGFAETQTVDGITITKRNSTYYTYVQDTDDTAFILSTSDLPSYYLSYFVNGIWNSNT